MFDSHDVEIDVSVKLMPGVANLDIATYLIDGTNPGVKSGM